jgi:hypothetical protein
MEATENVRQLRQSHNSGAELIVPRHGVVTLFGYGIQVRVDRGHLLLEDGIGPDRRNARLPRVGHGLKRLVVIGSDGMVSLAALRWNGMAKCSQSPGLFGRRMPSSVALRLSRIRPALPCALRGN